MPLRIDQSAPFFSGWVWLESGRFIGYVWGFIISHPSVDGFGFICTCAPIGCDTISMHLASYNNFNQNNIISQLD